MVLMLTIQKYKYWSFRSPEDYGSLPQPAGNKMQWQEASRKLREIKYSCIL